MKNLENCDWYLPSARGVEQFCGTFIDFAVLKDNDFGILTDISLIGKAKPPIQFGGSDYFYNENLPISYLLNFQQVLVRYSSVLNLCKAIDKWIIDYSDVFIEFANIEDGSVSIKISIREDLSFISSKEKPVCTIECVVNRLECLRWNFVVDQSCMRIFLNGLRVGLERLGVGGSR